MKEYIRVLETIKQQFESALDDGQNSTDIDAIEAVKDNALAIEALNMATQALTDFPAMLEQYLGENDLKIIGNDVWEETKAKAEQTEWISVKDRLPESRELVLVTVYWHERYQVMIASYFGNGEWWCVPWNNCGEHMQMLKPIAWMPLPSPYKGDEDE